jgi:hypothetical protein
LNLQNKTDVENLNVDKKKRERERKRANVGAVLKLEN